MLGEAKRDIRTVTGSNIALLTAETEMNPVQACLGKVKQKLLTRVSIVPDLGRVEAAVPG